MELPLSFIIANGVSISFGIIVGRTISSVVAGMVKHRILNKEEAVEPPTPAINLDALREYLAFTRSSLRRVLAYPDAQTNEEELESMENSLGVVIDRVNEAQRQSNNSK